MFDRWYRCFNDLNHIIMPTRLFSLFITKKNALFIIYYYALFIIIQCIIYYYPFTLYLLGQVFQWQYQWQYIMNYIVQCKIWNWEGPKILWIFIFNNHEMHVEVNPAHITGLVRMHESVFITWIIYFTTNKSKCNHWAFRKLIPSFQLHNI